MEFSKSLSIESIDDKEINEALKKVLDIVEMEQERDFVSNAELFNQLVAAFSIDSNMIPKSVSKDYIGVHLGNIYEDNDLKLLLKSFKNNQTLDAFYAIKIINDAKEKFIKIKNIQECVIEDPNEKGCIIVGDIHGHFNDLYHIIEKYGIPGAGYKFIFNGDFVDRGPKQIECLLIILYSFLIRPKRVFINRGNHEDISLNSSRLFSPNFMNNCRKLYGKYGSAVYKSANDLFTALPLATSFENKITKFRYFVVHGGISSTLDLDFVNTINRFAFDKIMPEGSKLRNEGKAVGDMLWSDPIRLNDEGNIVPKSAKKLTGCYFNSQRNLGCIFGVDITEKFCKKNSYNGIIRSHEVRDKGYSEDHTRCFTIFSASYYCGGNNFGAVFKFLTNDPSFEVYSFKNLNGDFSSLTVKRNNYLLKQFKLLIESKEKELVENFSKYDVRKDGNIRTDIWADIVSRAFNGDISVRHLRAIKDLLCECETTLDCVNYKSLFRKTGYRKQRSTEDGNFLNIVTNLFEILDLDGDKRISVSEAEHALEKLNKTLGTKFSAQQDCINFVKQMDKNGDNHIDLEEFKSAFMEPEYLDEEFSNSENSDDDDDNGDIQIVRL